MSLGERGRPDALGNVFGDGRGPQHTRTTVGSPRGPFFGLQLFTSGLHRGHFTCEIGSFSGESLSIDPPQPIIIFCYLGLSERAVGGDCERHTFNAHLHGLPVGVDATAELEQADLRHPVAEPHQRPVRHPQKSESVRDRPESAVRPFEWHLERATDQTVQADTAGSGEDQRGVSSAHRRHRTVAESAGEDLSVTGVVGVSFRRTHAQGWRFCLGQQRTVRFDPKDFHGNSKERRLKN